MSHSKAKQIAEKKKSKTKRNGNGSKYHYAKRKGMRKGPKSRTGATKRRK